VVNISGAISVCVLSFEEGKRWAGKEGFKCGRWREREVYDRQGIKREGSI
jgi:hypothetical protein